MQKMKIPVLLVTLYVSSILAQLQRDEKCTTPTNKDGICTSIKSCDIIQAIITQARLGNKTAIELGKRYQCGYGDNEVLVCCDALSNDELFHTLDPVLQPISLQPFNSTDLPDRSICGVSAVDGEKIFGGDKTGLKEFPWMAALEMVNREDNKSAGVRCGGSLISDRYVLTAAHCIKDSEFRIDKVRLGDWNLTTDPDCIEVDTADKECNEPVQVFSVEKEIAHEFYGSADSSNDIGLLKLDRTATLSPSVRPICLPPPGLPLAELYSYMTAVGWGLTENGSTSDVKLKVDVPLVSNGVCRKKLPRQPISKNHYCAGGEPGKDTCTGDSGGPLMRVFRNDVNKPEQYFLEGIVVSGVSACGRPGNPGIYARVTEYTNWIIQRLAEERLRSANRDEDLDYKPLPAFINFPSR